ncbi:transcriptional protein SWT1 isoform X2 [Trichomycterus rosablanca]|uniref:transcriptional protein SWT1 isoform X2 n=1 Tax=Trichomycterus rosablanca TaxID=2290929 RepID=UPI002F35F767
MTKKKSMKHKKELKKERPSTSSCEDQEEDDPKRSGSSKSKSKHNHAHRRSTGSPRSPREDSVKTFKHKQSDEKKQKFSRDSDGASHDSGKHSSSKHHSSSTRKTSSSSSSSQAPKSKPVSETVSKHSEEVIETRRPAPKQSHPKSSQDWSLTEEQRKKLLKRRSSKQEDDYPVPKRHSRQERADGGTHKKSDKLCQDGKELEVRKSKKSGEDHVSEWKCQDGEELEVKKSKKSGEDHVSEWKCQDGKELEVKKSKKSGEDHVSEWKCQDGEELEVKKSKKSGEDNVSEWKCQDGKELEAKKSKKSGEDHVSEWKCQDGKELEAKKSKKSGEDHISEWKCHDGRELEVKKSKKSGEDHVSEWKCQDGKELEVKKSKKSGEDHVSEWKCQDGKELEVKKSKKSGEDHVSEWKFKSDEKTWTESLSKEPPVVSKPPASEVTPNVSHQGGHKVQHEPALHSTLKAKTSSKLGLPITFKIPKKLSVLKARTEIWDAALAEKKPSFIGKHASLVSAKKQSPSSKAVPQPTVQRPPKVSSQVPLYSAPQKPFCLPEDKLLHDRETKDTSSPSKTPPVVSHQTISAEPTENTDDDQEMQLVEELHQARTNRQLQVNVVESYGELTGMDVDPPEEGTTVTFSQEPCQRDVLIVLDTNVLLSHLDFVKKIRSHGLGALGFPKLLVPWVVLQELDSLKSGKLSKDVERKARPAVDYIYNCLKNQEPRLLGQSMQLASQAAYGLNTANNDDRVLQCCLQYQKLYPDGALILCTNDKNLCSKALLSGVKTLSKADLQQQAEVNPAHFNYSYSSSDASPFVTPVKEGQNERSRRANEEEEVNRRKSAVKERELSECVSMLESSLRSSLAAVLEEEMKAAFGELWTEIVYVKPPWTLEGLLQCFKKHWIAVFGNIIKRTLLGCVETLSSCFKTDESVDCSSILLAVCAAEDLLTALSSRSAYRGHVHSTLSCLKSLHQRLQAQLQQTPAEDTDGDTLMAEAVEDVAPPPQASHQEVWALFENIWNNVCNVSSALFTALHFSPGSEDSVQHLHTCPPQDALNCLHRLSAALGQLLEAFQRLLSVDSTVEDAQALLAFIQTSTIAAMEPRFNAQDLLECLSHQEYREKLCVGGSQMMELKANLDRCGKCYD